MDDCIIGKVREYRKVWRQHHGELPKGKLIRHLCHNQLCCNIDHLAIGTAKENREDDMRNNPNFPWGFCNRKGTKNHQNKLTEEQAYRIKFSNERRCDLARELGVTAYAIDKIRKGQNWTWLKKKGS